MMTDSIFDNLLPPPRELDAFVAAQVMGWQDVRWHPAQAIYVGTCPDDTVEVPVPQFTEREDLVDSVLTALQGLGHGVQITPVPVPHDCSDGFLYAYWRRPAAYLDPYIRSGSSSFWAISNAEAGLQKLRWDLETGEWERRYAELLTLGEYDAGYRLVVTS